MGAELSVLSLEPLGEEPLMSDVWPVPSQPQSITAYWLVLIILLG